MIGWKGFAFFVINGPGSQLDVDAFKVQKETYLKKIPLAKE